MNWSYISGFFDADGSITAVTISKGRNKSLQVSFHNNEIYILKSIQDFIQSELGFNGTISTKVKVKENHNTAYDLKYTNRQALEVARNLTIYHPKKEHRLRVYNLIQEKTKRNGKYTEEELKERDELVDLFFDFKNI